MSIVFETKEKCLSSCSFNDYLSWRSSQNVFFGKLFDNRKVFFFFFRKWFSIRHALKIKVNDAAEPSADKQEFLMNIKWWVKPNFILCIFQIVFALYVHIYPWVSLKHIAFFFYLPSWVSVFITKLYQNTFTTIFFPKLGHLPRHLSRNLVSLP